MAYNGFLVKVGDYIIPHKYIKAESYTGIRRILDMDSYRDANGKLHRNALEHKGFEVTFETPRLLTNRDINDLMSNIRRNYTVASERKVMATFYVFEYDSYQTAEMYLADPEFNIYGIFDGVIKYNSIKFEFTSY